MWETVETSAREIGIGEAEGRRGTGGKREEKGREGEKEKTEEGENDRSKESSGGVGDMGRRRGGGEVRGRSKEVGTGEVSSVDKGVWEEAVRKDADEEGVGSRNKCKRRVCSEEGKGVPIVERRERGGEGVREGTIKEGIHPAV